MPALLARFLLSDLGRLVIVAHVIEHGLMAGRILVFRALRIEISLSGDRLQAAIGLAILPFQLLIQLLLLKLGLNECAVIEIPSALEIGPEEVEVRADSWRCLIRRKRFTATTGSTSAEIDPRTVARYGRQIGQLWISRGAVRRV